MAQTIFGQFVIGPPGSGKTTYCKFISENLKQLGRNSKVINLDPANDCLPYKPSIDLADLVSVQNVMMKEKLGPNGALIRCLEILDDNFAWLYDSIVSLLKAEQDRVAEMKKNASEEIAGKGEESLKSRPYLIFDCAGQSELYTHHKVMKNIIKKLTNKNSHFDLRLVCLNLCDAYHASDFSKYIAVVMNSLSTMINLELPHLNILSKVDKIESYGKTRFNLDFYCEVLDLKYLLDTELDGPFHQKYRKLTEGIISVIDDKGLVFFTPLNIQQAGDIYNVIHLADKANGYVCDDLDLAVLQLNPSLMELVSGRRLDPLEDATMTKI